MQKHSHTSVRHTFRAACAVVVSLCALLGVVLAGCSTKRNTWLSRNYQKLTSHYNVYFNATEAFDHGVETVRNSTTNDYSHVLPVYEFANATNAKAAKQDMGTVLKKSHKLVQLHSITVKPEHKDNETAEDKRFRSKNEFNPYVPEGYLLMGKANVLLHDEQEALKYFDYLDRMHTGERPTYEGTIWKAIAYTQIGQYNNALASLKGYDADGIAPTELYADYQAAYANVYICQEMYAEAIPYIKKAADETKDRHAARRYKYILAQIYRAQGKKTEAAPLFLKLSKNLQDYDMAFAAKMDLATVATTDEELQKAEKSLRKMAGDDKYENEQDQVYYALGHIEQNRGHEPQAVACFAKSTELSVNNENQKGLSFLALADIYQARPQYIDASMALDSAAEFLAETNLRKKEAQDRAALLAPLGKELRTIRDNDSLMTIARMDTKSREKLLEKMVKEDADRRQAARDAAEADQQNALSQSDFYQMTNQMNRSGAPSNWYFYNQQLVTAGKSTFRSRWGNRKNEDDWRRKDKSSTASMGGDMLDGDENATNADEAALQEAISEADANAPMSIRGLMAGLPLTPDAQKQMDEETAAAFLKSAGILYDNVHDYPAAVAQLQEMLRRYPNNRHRADALALLHFAQRRTGDTAGLRETDRTIARDYPESKMAKFLARPEFLQDEEARRQEGERRYEAAYAAYLTNNFAQAQALATNALADTATEQAHRPRYLLVRAMANAKEGNANAFRADLTQIGAQYAGTPQDSTAKRLLALLDEGRTPVRHTAYESPLGNQKAQEEEAIAARKAEYVYQPDSAQLVMCVVDNDLLKEAQFIIADYNFTNYIIRDFDLAMRTLPGNKSVIVISTFANIKEAKEYFYALREQPFWKEISQEAVPQIFIMSKQNYRLVGLSGIDAAFTEFVKENLEK